MSLDRTKVNRVHPNLGGPSMTQQHHADDADINKIAGRYLKTGQLPPTNSRQGVFGIMPSGDYHAILNFIADTKQQFEALPSKVRKRFDNDPFQVIRFVEDSNNHEEAVKLGILKDIDSDPFEQDPNQESLIDQLAKAAVKAAREAGKADPEAQPTYPKAPESGANKGPSAPSSPKPT